MKNNNNVGAESKFSILDCTFLKETIYIFLLREPKHLFVRMMMIIFKALSLIQIILIFFSV